jgi:GNAT superfamily N-acetyltransferase
MGFELIDNACGWRAVLAGFRYYETYHTWDFTMIEAGRHACRAFALSFQDGEQALFLPLLERDIPGGDGCKDLTSVYGYPGPLYDGAWTGFAQMWKSALDWLREAGYVSLFSRCSTLFTARMPVLPAEFQCASSIVVIDLTLPEEEQWAQYRRNHKDDVLRALAAGVRVERSMRDAADFLRLYHATMDKVGAADDYYYDSDYVEAMLHAQDFETRLYVCRFDGRVVAAGLFLYCGDTVQYHLCGSDRDYLKLGTAKLLIDAVRREAAAEGYARFVLGGGSRDERDSLFHYKLGFSKQVADFHVIKSVLDRDAYLGLSGEIEAVDTSGYFPAYRDRRMAAAAACLAPEAP